MSMSIAIVGDFFSQMYAYREYLKQSVARDLRKRYKRSFLGYIWSMLHPLLMMGILAIVFANLMGSRTKDYAVFLFAGMLAWTYFSSTTEGCLGTIRANARLMDNVSVPKYIFPLSIAYSNLANLFLSLVPLLIVMLFVGHPIHLTLLLLPVVLAPLFMVTVGVSLIFAVSNVFFEDTQHLVSVVLRAAYYLCPVLYTRDKLPEWLIDYISINPMFGIIEQMHDIIYNGTIPNPDTYFANLMGSLLVLVFGLWIFKKSDDKFIYFI